MRVLFFSLAAVAWLGFPAISCGETAMGEVPIAAVYPMTGPTGSFGQEMMKGWNLAVEEINAQGGIKSLGGARIRTELRDTEGKPRVGMSEVEKVARDKAIPLMAGCWASTVTFPVSQVSEQYGLPHLIGIATQTQIMRRGFQYVFRYAMDNERSGKNIVDFVQYQGKRTGKAAKRAAMMTVDDNFGRDLARSIKKAIEGTDQKIVAEIYYPLKVTSVDVEVAKIKAANPDVIYLTGFLYDATLITKALRVHRVNPLGIVTLGGTSNPEYLRMTGNMAEYFFGQYKYDSDLNRREVQEFDAKVMRRYGRHGNPFIATGYGLVYLIKDVLERAGTIERDKVRDAIASTNITRGRALVLPGKFVRFDKNHENIGAREHICQVLNGKWHNVWPIDMPHKHEAVWPMPKYEAR